MKPENLIIRNGCYILRIDSFIDYGTKKPTCRMTCIEDDTSGQNIDGEYEHEYTSAIFYLHKKNIDIIIERLQEIKTFLI